MSRTSALAQTVLRSQAVHFVGLWVLAMVVGLLAAGAFAGGTARGTASADTGKVEPREAPHVEASRRVAAVLEGAASGGLDASRAHQIGGALSGRSIGALPTLVSGYAMAVAQSRGISSPVPPRVGTIVVGAAAVPLLYVLAEWGLGAWGGALAAALLLSCPQFVHDLGIAGSDAPLVAAWLLVLVPYAASALGRLATSTGALATGLAFAVALLVDEGAAWALLLVAVHFAVTQGPAFVADLRRGQLTLPSAWLGMLVLGLCTLVVFWTYANDNPFAANGPLVTRWTAADVRIALPGNRTAADVALPWYFGLGWLFLAFQGPAPVVVAAFPLVLLGQRLTRLVVERRDRTAPAGAPLARVATPPKPLREEGRWLAALIAVTLFYLCLVSPFAPGPLARIPPSISVALPAVALATSLILVGAYRHLSSKTWRWPARPRVRNGLLAGLLSATVVLPGAFASLVRSSSDLVAYETALLGGGGLPHGMSWGYRR